jgi:hypothetical protein
MTNNNGIRKVGVWIMVVALAIGSAVAVIGGCSSHSGGATHSITHSTQR